MSTVMEGILDGSGKRFGLVAGRFNDLISRKLLDAEVRSNGEFTQIA